MTKVVLDPQWAGRRRAIKWQLFAAWGTIWLSLLVEASVPVVVPAMAAIITLITSGYVFGAVAERINGVPSNNKPSKP